MIKKLNDRGQGMTELVVMLPIFLMMTAAAMGFLYTEWQGVKTQEAANLAARIQGQEHLGGGSSIPELNQLNGNQQNWDKPTAGILGRGGSVAQMESGVRMVSKDQIDQLYDHGAHKLAGMHTVQQKIFKKIQDIFGQEESKHVLVPEPVPGATTDTVEVDRVIKTPTAFGLDGGGIVIKSTAYSGAEDTYIYGLPRWGPAGAAAGSGDLSQSYWLQIMKARQQEVSNRPQHPE